MVEKVHGQSVCLIRSFVGNKLGMAWYDTSMLLLWHQIPFVLSITPRQMQVAVKLCMRR